MSEIVLVTELEFSKAEELFRAEGRFEVRPAPADERPLAEAVLAAGSRALIVGVVPYRSLLYEALAKTGGANGSIIARFGVGHDSIDKTLAKQNNIVVTNTPGALDVSVAEHAIWLMGDMARRISSSSARLKAGQFQPHTGAEVRGKVLGIVGFGRIGRRVAATAHFGFGMKVLAGDCVPPPQFEKREGRTIEQIKAEFGVELYTTDVESVFRQADVLSIHLPTVAETNRFVNADRIGLMKPDALLINTARGSVLDEDALYDALSAGRLAGAALDVFQTEPYQPVSPGKDLRTLENVLLTPHVGSNTRQSNERMGRAALENLANFFAGRLDELTQIG